MYASPGSIRGIQKGDTRLSLEQELLDLKSFKVIEGLLIGETLKELQCVDLLKMMYRKKGLIMYDTGTGKTYLMAAVIRMLLNKNSNNKFLMLVKNKQMLQTPEKVERLLGFKIVTTTGNKKIISKNISEYSLVENSVIMMTHAFLKSPMGLEYLIENKKYICCVLIDEAHELNNSFKGESALILQALCNDMEYVFAMTATPITHDIGQLVRLANIIDPKTYPNTLKLSNSINNGSFSIEDDPMFFISRAKADFGTSYLVKGFVEWVKPMKHQVSVDGNNLIRLCKGEGAINQARALAIFCKKHSNEKGIIFINEHKTREWVLPFLEDEGVRYGCINSTTGKTEAEDINKFNNTGELDVIITSITEGLDLEADWVMFYEFTLDVQQLIGRAHRGFEDKVLEVYFMVTKATGEADYFIRNIWSVAKDIQNILGKDYVAVREVAQKLD